MVSDASGERTTILGGRYRLERVLGEGAFGRVYVAFDSRLQRTVAIKELLATKTTADPRVFEQYLDRFEREARAAGSVFHPNIVNVFELAIDTDNNYYLIMEYIERGNLRDLLRQVTTLPIERALGITVEIARALEAIHEVDIVHRDLKPANIMLTSRGVAKLADFGVAQLSHESQRTQITVGHPGTPLYMSPEQRQNTDYLDGRSDLYSLGLILYEMLAGEPFGRRKQPLEALRPDLSGPILRIFTRLTERDLDRRYQTAEEVIADLQIVLASESQDTGTAGRATGDTIVDDRARPIHPAAPPVEPTIARSSAATGPPLTAGTLPPAATGAEYASGPSPIAAPTPLQRSRMPAILGAVGGVIVAALIGGWLITHSGKQTSGPQTATPVASSGQTRVASVAVTVSPSASATALVSAGITPTPSATGTPTPAPPTITPTTPPTVQPSATTPPNFQAVTNPKYAFTFAYPKAWQRSDDETDQDTLYAFRISPTAAFLVAKEDNPAATTLDAYIDQEIHDETTQRPGWKAGTRVHQATMLGGQPAQVADFLVPTATGQDYHYYVFTLRPKQAWGLLFSMPLNDFSNYQKDIDDIVRSFVFCAGGTCPAASAQLLPSGSGWSAPQPASILIATLPRRRTTT